MFHRTTQLFFVVGMMFAAATAATPTDASAAPAGKIKLLMVHNGGHNFNGFKQTMDPAPFMC